MTGPLVRNPKPLMDALIRYVDAGDPPRAETVLAVALRAALGECAEEQAACVAGLGMDASQAFHDMCHGRLYMANKVVRAVEEQLGRLPTERV